MKPLNYDTLAALPLFMGMDGAMLSSFYDEARPAVTIVRQGTMIARRGEECRTLTIVMDGSITVTSSDPHGICEIARQRRNRTAKAVRPAHHIYAYIHRRVTLQGNEAA